ncbi:MAG: TolB family protein [Spirochaetaceae bacterium]
MRAAVVFSVCRAVLVGVMLTLLGACMDASLSQAGGADVGIRLQGVPPSVDDTVITISGSGMTAISATIDRDTDAVVIEVPIGPDRVFEAQAGPFKISVTRSVTAGGITVHLAFTVPSEGRLLFARGSEYVEDGQGEAVLNAAHLYTIGADGANERKLTEVSAPVNGFGWSNDGDWILLISQHDETEGELYRLAADGSAFFRITDNTVAETVAGFEPSGTRVAYAYGSENSSAVFVTDIAKTDPEETLVAASDSDQAGFTFSQQAIIDATDGTVWVGRDVFDPWSPDGTGLLYSRDEAGAVGESLSGRLYITTDLGATETPISDAEAAAVDAQWLRDGSGVIYAQTAAESTNMNIYRYDLLGEEATPLTTANAVDRNLRLSPDGRTILFERFDGESSAYLLLDLASGEETPITGAGDFEAYYADWMAGTGEIATLGLDLSTGNMQVRFFSSTGTELDVIQDPGLAMGFPMQWSNDGQTAAVLLDESGEDTFDLYSLVRDTGTFVQITDTPDEVEIGGYWRP